MSWFEQPETLHTPRVLRLMAVVDNITDKLVEASKMECSTDEIGDLSDALWNVVTAAQILEDLER